MQIDWSGEQGFDVLESKTYSYLKREVQLTTEAGQPLCAFEDTSRPAKEASLNFYDMCMHSTEGGITSTRLQQVPEVNLRLGVIFVRGMRPGEREPAARRGDRF